MHNQPFSNIKYLIKNKITKSIATEKLFRVDYVSVADSITLAEISGFIEKDILVSTAVFLCRKKWL